MNTTSDTAVKLYDSATQQLLTFSADEQLGGLFGTMTKMLDADPNFVMGKVMKVGLCTFEANSRMNAEIKKDIDEIIDIKEKKSLNKWEELHCNAVIEMGLGNRHKASQIWEEILMQYPKDILAMKNAQLNYVYLGNSVMLRDLFARVLPYWKPTEPEYGYIMNLYAFGLEETNLFEEAEKTLKRGLMLAPEDEWGVHTFAHLYESTSRHQEAADFLLENESWWGHGGLACHNYWHLSNYYVEINAAEDALAIFDQHIQPLFKSNGSPFSVDDGCQLLQKLEFEGVDVGDRWQDVQEAYISFSPDNFICYHDTLKLFCLPHSKDENKSKKFVESVEEYISLVNEDNTKTTREVALNVMKGIVAYTEGCYDDAVEYLYPVKYQFVRVGGSNAQRDIFDLLLINACLKSKLARNLKRGRSLLYERKSLKKDSPLTERLLNRLLSVHSERL